MLKRLTTFLLLSVLLAPITMRADEVTIGDGTAPSYYAPFNTYYEYSWNQTIYPSSSFSGECNITSVAYDCAEAVANPLTLDTLRIFMGITEMETHTGEGAVDWLPESELTLVYEGAGVVIGDAAGWKTFQLDNAYTYPGEGNLVVVVAKRASSYNQNIKFKTTASTLAGFYREGFASTSYSHHPGGAAGSYLNCFANIKMEVELSNGPSNQVVIGDGTSPSDFAPFNTYHEYSWNQTIYPGSSFSGECNITSVAYDCAAAVASPLTLDTLRIYMGLTELDNHIGEGGNQWLSESELTLVYEGVGVVIGDAAGWKTFQLDNAYTYPGEGNLVIVVAKTASNYNNLIKFKTTSSPFATLYRESFASASYFHHPGGAQGSYLNYYANIRMDIESSNTPVTTGTVNGVVTFENTPLAGVSVAFEGINGTTDTYNFTTAEDGTYSGTLNAGTYAATASLEGYETLLYANDVVIVAGTNTADINFAMEAVVTLDVTAVELDANNVKVQWSMDIVGNYINSFQYFNVYRTSCSDTTGEDATLIATQLTEVEYTDNTWGQATPGNYKWGVSFVYGPEPRESNIAWNGKANRTTTGYGLVLYPYEDCGYTEFDLETASVNNKINTAAGFAAGEYYNGAYYVAKSFIPQYMAKLNPETGEEITSAATGLDNRVLEMAYDYSTNTMYAYLSNSYGSINKLGVVNLETLAVTETIDLGAALKGMFCTTSGQLYGMTKGTGSTLVSINKVTGEVTTVGTATELYPIYSSSATYDHNTGIAYFACGDSAGDKLFTINLETGAATEVGAFKQVVGLYVPYTPTVTGGESDIVMSNCLEKTNVNTVIENLYVSPTGFAMWDGETITPTPSGNTEFFFDFDNGMQGWTTIDADGDGHIFGLASDYSGDLGYNSSANALCSQSYINVLGPLTPDNYAITPQKYAITSSSTLSFYACAQDEGYAAEHFGVAISTTDNTNAADFTIVQEWTMTAKGDRHDGQRGLRQGNWYNYTVDLSAYAGQEVWIAFRHFNCTDMYMINIDNAQLSAAKAGRDEAIAYKVLLDGVEEAQVLTPYYQHDVTNLVEGQTYTTSVAEVYADGISEYSTYEWTYMSCSNYEGANLTATANGSDVVLSWTIGQSPVGDEFYFDFEDGMQGWTKIDADGDGYFFGLMSDYNGDTGHNGSADALCSMSYINTIGPLTPDDYAITPQKYNIAAGSNLNFWACGQDAGWAAEHIGVAISTTGNTNAADFTTIWEHTLTAKGERHEGPRGTREQGTWYEFNVDLSEYSGQEVWIAFRHFNCTDMFMVNIDDVTLSNSQRRGREVTTFTFDNGMQGWTTIDADGDGYNFTMLSELEGTPGHNGSADAICSQSYIPFYGPLTPDNYIVSPNKYLIDENSSVNFFACGEDGAFPSEHFGLAISSGSNTNPADFTTIADWTLTGKAQGTWHEFTVSLAEYAGQELYIAFRHYDISNWYIMDIDDVTITSAGAIAPVPYVLGTAIFRNGEYLAFAQGNEYTDSNLDEGEYEYCVRVVYSNYAMSCESCDIANVTSSSCDAPENLIGEYAWNSADEFGAKISWGELVIPVESWLFYDDGANVDAIGLQSGGSFYWGIMIPSTMLQPYAGTSLTKVAYFDYVAHTGKVMIYQGGATAPGTLVHQQNYTANGAAQYVEWDLTAAIPVDVTQNLWIVMNNDSEQYVAACGNNTGDANGRWISVDGTEWMDITAAGIQATWNLRGFVTNTRTGELIPVEAPALNGTPGATLANAGVSRQGDVVMDFTARDLALVSYKVYRSTSNDNYSLIATVPAEEGQDYYEYFDEIEAGTYYYQVTAYYEGTSGTCESEPAISATNPANNYVIVSVTSVDGADLNARVYPNPTNGNVTIEAVGMKQITVVSALGQVVYNREVNSDSEMLNMAEYKAGIYMVRIATENGVSVQRVTVVR